jgi:hypothetical protein
MSRKNFLSEKAMFQTDYSSSKHKKVPQRLFIGAKYSGLSIEGKKFQAGYVSEQNVPERLLSEQKIFRTDYLSQQQNCEWKVTHKTRTELFPVRPATSCPQDLNKR